MTQTCYFTNSYLTFKSSPLLLMEESPQKTAAESPTKEEASASPTTAAAPEAADVAPKPFSALVAIAALKNDSGAISELAWYKSTFVFLLHTIHYRRKPLHIPSPCHPSLSIGRTFYSLFVCRHYVCVLFVLIVLGFFCLFVL